MTVKAATFAVALILAGQSALASEWERDARKTEKTYDVISITKKIEADIKDIESNARVIKCDYVVTYHSGGSSKNDSHAGICSIYFANQQRDVLVCHGTVTHNKLTIKFDDFSYSYDETANFVEANCIPGG